MYNVMFKLDGDIPVSTPSVAKQRVGEGLYKTVCEDIRNLMRDGSCTIAYARLYSGKELVKECHFEYGMPDKETVHQQLPESNSKQDGKELGNMGAFVS